VDDYIKVAHKRNLGLTGRAKLGLQITVSACIGMALVYLETQGNYSTRLVVHSSSASGRNLVVTSLQHVPHLYYLSFLPFLLFTILVIVGSSNAVNLTDGLDGLAIGCTIIAAGALTVLTYVSGHVVFADYLNCSAWPLAGELTVFCGSLVGASIGFLCTTRTSRGLYGRRGLAGTRRSHWHAGRDHQTGALLPFIGGIFVLEALSVILQVGSYKLRKEAHLQDGPAATITSS